MPGAPAPFGSERRLVRTAPAGRVDSAAVRRGPGQRRGVHEPGRPSGAAGAPAGITPYHLPPDSPDLDRVEGVWRHVKHEGLPVRGRRPLDDPRTAVEAALRDHTARLPDATNDLPEAG